MLRYSVYVNDEYLNEYAADGVLVATPTGSTAYNLSAGGPVIAPGARMMVLTPICSHSLNARSIVLAPEDRVRIKVLNSGQVVSFDGDTSMELKAGDCIDIRCSGAADSDDKGKADIIYAEPQQPSWRNIDSRVRRTL